FPDGRIIYGIRATGDIKLYDPATQSTTLLFHVTNVVSNGEQGLLGLAVDPKWPAKPFVFAYATRDTGGGNLRNQILRIKVQADKGVSSRKIFQSDTTAGDYHDGGRITFGPDGKLYAVV